MIRTLFLKMSRTCLHSYDRGAWRDALRARNPNVAIPGCYPLTTINKQNGARAKGTAAVRGWTVYGGSREARASTETVWAQTAMERASASAERNEDALQSIKFY